MLSSRYIHLHEALGLGPLWLKRGIQVQGAKERVTVRKSVPRLPETESPKISVEKVQAIIAQLTPTADCTPAAPMVQNAVEIDLAVRLVYALTQNDKGSVLWLTLRSNLNAPAHDIGQGKFGHLLKQLMRACGHTDAVWHSVAVDDEAPLTGCLKLLAQHHEARLVLLGEDITDMLRGHTTLDENTLTLSHPARLLRQGVLKKTTWRQLETFFFGEKT